jgi:FdrA protein
VSLLLFDLVLGDGAHLDPAPELTDTIKQARLKRGDQPLLVIASVSGTDLDPQDLNRQIRLLTSVGVHVLPSAAQAAKLAAAVMTKGAGHVA